MRHIFVIYSSIYDHLFSVEPSISFLNILPSYASLHWLQMLKNKKKLLEQDFKQPRVASTDNWTVVGNWTHSNQHKTCIGSRQPNPQIDKVNGILATPPLDGAIGNGYLLVAEFLKMCLLRLNIF